MEHLFFSCPYAQSLWRGAHLPDQTIIDPTISFEVKLKSIISFVNNKNLNPIDRQQPIWILWRIWKSRNLLVYGRQQSCWQMDLKQARHEAREWTMVLYKDEDGGEINQVNMGLIKLSKWEKSPYGYVKVNYDGSKRQHMSTGGFFLDGGQSKRAVFENGNLETEFKVFKHYLMPCSIRGLKAITRLYSKEIINM